MTHFQFVRNAIDLLAETHQPLNWLAEYDSALASSSDAELLHLISRLKNELDSYQKRAA